MLGYAVVATLHLSDLFLETVKTIERRAPHPARPHPDEEDAYFRGVAHGYLTAFAWGDELLAAARQLALLTGARDPAAFLNLACAMADALHEQSARDAVFFDDSESESGR